MNVQMSLGAVSHSLPQACRLCGEQLDPRVEQSETCNIADANNGHYACVQALVRGLRLADTLVTRETEGSTTSTSRPAGILTLATFPGRITPLDVCVASQNDPAAMGDAAEAAFRKILGGYWAEIRELS